MKKKLIGKKGAAVLLSALLMVTSLCGCSADLDMKLEEDGSGTMTQTVMIEKEYMGSDDTSDLDDGFTYVDVTENGKEYKKGTKTDTFKNVKEIPDMEGTQIAFDEKCFYIREESAVEASEDASLGISPEEMKAMLQMNYTITFPYEVKHTNGKVQADKKTVVWDSDQLYANANCWAVFQESLLDKTIPAPKLAGVKNNGYYKKNVTVKASSDTIIDTLSVNGRAVGANNCDISREGKNVVICTDVNGNASKITFVIDKTKPVVKGVANGKTYKSAKTIKFSDKYGVKSATLNGKKISTGKKVSKKGSYKLVVKDKAGNQNVVKFKIK